MPRTATTLTLLLATGEPVVLLHGSFRTITSSWSGWVEELSKTLKVMTNDFLEAEPPPEKQP